MTVTNPVLRHQYSGDGVQTTFDYDNPIDDSDILSVFLFVDGVKTLLQNGEDYTVTGVGAENGGTIILTDPAPNGSDLTILYSYPLTQTFDLTNVARVFTEDHEKALDRIVYGVLGLSEKVDRAVLVPEDGSVEPDNYLSEIQSNREAAEASAQSADASADRAEAAASELEQINNFSATTNPTVNDDAGDLYGRGSRWINTTTGAVFTCVDATAGAAVWVRIVESSVYGGTTVFLEDIPGFVGDGVADDSAALIAAVAALPTRGGTIVLPGKRIGYNSPISDAGKSVRFVGQGSGSDLTRSATVLTPLSDVDGFRFTASRSELSDVSFDARSLCGTTPLSYTGTTASRCVIVGYGFANAAYCVLKRIRFMHVPSLAIYWQEGSHLLIDQVVGFCCHGGGMDMDASGFDNNHGNFQDLHFTYCRGQSLRTRGAFHIYKQLKFFANETAPKLLAGQSVGNIFVEQHATARGNFTRVNGSATISGVSDYLLINTFVGASVTGTNIPSNTRVVAVDKTAKTITLNQPMTSSGTDAVFVLAKTSEQQCVLELGKNSDGIMVLGDQVDPGRVTLVGDFGGYLRVSSQNDFSLNREVRAGAFRLRPAPNAGAPSTANSIGDAFLATFTSGSPTVADVPADAFGRIRVGQTISGYLIPGSTTISAVDKTANTITMSANATGSGSNYASCTGGGLFGGKRELIYDANRIVELSDFTINSVQKWFGGSGSVYRGYLTNGGADVELLTRAEANVNETIGTGWLVFSPYVAWGTTVTDVSNLASGTVTMSANATATVSNEPIIFIRPSSSMLLGIIGGLPVYASDAAASGLTKGMLYQTSTGEVRIKL